MRQTTGSERMSSENIIKHATRKQDSPEEKNRIVLDGERSEDSIAELCCCEGVSQGSYFSWSKDLVEAGKRRLARETARAATIDEVKALSLTRRFSCIAAKRLPVFLHNARMSAIGILHGIAAWTVERRLRAGSASWAPSCERQFCPATRSSNTLLERQHGQWLVWGNIRNRRNTPTPYHQLQTDGRFAQLVAVSAPRSIGSFGLIQCFRRACHEWPDLD